MDLKLVAGGVALLAVGAAGYWLLTRQPPPVTGRPPVAGPTPGMGTTPAPGQPVTTLPVPNGGDIVMRPAVIAYCRDGTMVPAPDPSFCVGRGGLYGMQPPAGVEIKPWPYWGTEQPVAELPHRQWWYNFRNVIGLPVQPPGGIYS